MISLSLVRVDKKTTRRDIFPSGSQFISALMRHRSPTDSHGPEPARACPFGIISFRGYFGIDHSVANQQNNILGWLII